MSIHVDDKGNSFYREGDEVLGEWTPEELWPKLPHGRWETAVVACKIHNSYRERVVSEFEELDRQYAQATAERDRLAAENAELKARYLHVAELNHNQVSMVRADCAALAAANATLDALREAVPRDSMICTGSHEGQWMLSVWHILYPQPAALAEEKKNG